MTPELSIRAQMSEIKREIIDLGGKKKALEQWFETPEAKQLAKKFDELKASVSNTEDLLKSIDKRIFEAELRKATADAELKVLQADIEAGRKYLEKNILSKQNNLNELASLDSIISDKHREAALLDTLIANKRNSIVTLSHSEDGIRKRLGEAEAYELWRNREYADLEGKKQSIDDARKKVDSYYNEVKGIEKSVQEEKENVRQQALALSGHSVVKFIKNHG